MGNNVSGVSRVAGALDSYVSELGADVIYEKSIGESRLLKAVRARHRHGPIVIKMFLKHDPNFSLRAQIRKLKAEREQLVDLPNVYNYQSFVETERAGYAIRQWLANNLYDRISTRPFLSTIEKRWIAFQIVNAMKEVKAKGVSHGDIRSENILLTSWNWIYITDFASSYKPVHLPEDDPADYSYYFDTTKRRTCYIAPERFYPSADKEKVEADEKKGVTEAMDVFSVGCVIAELFLEGRDTFSLAQLFKYRSGELDIHVHLAAIEDDAIKSLILDMLSLDPSTRPSFASVLSIAESTAVFPSSLHASLHSYISSINETSSPTLFARNPGPGPGPGNTRVVSGQPAPGAVAVDATGPNPRETQTSLPSDSDHRIERIWSEFEAVEPILLAEGEREGQDGEGGDGDGMQGTMRPARMGAALAGRGRLTQDLLPVEVHIPNRSSQWRDESGMGQNAAAEDGTAVIILSLICANIRNTTKPSSKLKALDLFLALAPFLTDESKLDRLVPYVVELLRDDSAGVRGAAIRTLTQVVMLVSALTASNASFFPEYILPNVRYLTRDPDVMVRVAYAQCIVPLAETAIQFLEMGQAVKAHGTVSARENKEVGAVFEEDSYDTRLKDLQAELEEQIVDLLVDTRPVVKRAILQSTAGLCVFFGRQKTNDVLLSHMITYLNDRDWLLREAFFGSIVSVAAHVGARSLDEYILPLMIQALSDVEETVVAKVLSSLTSLAELGLFQKLRIWELMSAATGFLYHPNVWIRQGAAAFISSAAKHLPPTDVWCILYPFLRPLLRSDIQAISETDILLTLKPPLSRPIFDAAVAWAMRADNSYFWDPSVHQNSKKADGATKGDSIPAEKASRSKIPRTAEDDAELDKLEQIGLKPGDESKILVLREYILKLAEAIHSFASRPPPEIAGAELTNQANGNIVMLQSLGIVPQTVFLNGRDVSSTAPSSRRAESTRRLSMNERRLTGAPSSNRGSRVGNEHLYSDLMRKLAQKDNSVISLNPHPIPPTANDTLPTPSVTSPGVSEGGDRAGMLSPRPSHPSRPPSSLAETSTAAHDRDHDALLSPAHRPSSPSAESLVSASLSVNTQQFPTSMRPSSRAKRNLLQGGDGGRKAAPAIGAVNTEATATGVLDTAHKLRAELGGSEEPSGRASPMSFAGTTTRRDSRVHRAAVPAPASTTYDGQEPAIANVLEHVYQDNFRDGLHDFGPRIANGPTRRRQPPRQTISRTEASSSRRTISSSVIANLPSHTGSITGLAVSPDHVFFVSSSDDKTVKVWDTARLERNVTSKPRHSYTQHHARVTCVCTVEESHCFASAAEDGSLHVVRVHVTVAGSLPKYGKLQTVREHRMDVSGEFITSMHHFNTDTTSSLIYTTTHGSIVHLDLRTMRILLTLTSPISHGTITASCIDTHKSHTWLITGTQTGMLTLWDLRFGLKLRSWKVGAGVSAALGTGTGFGTVAVSRIVPHPTSGKRTRVMVAIAPTAVESSNSGADSGLGAQTVIEVWDIARTALVETFVIDESGGTVLPSSASSSNASPSANATGDTATVLSGNAGRNSSEDTNSLGTSAADAIAAFVRARRAGSLAAAATTAGASSSPPSRKTSSASPITVLPNPRPRPTIPGGLPDVIELDSSDTQTIRNSRGDDDDDDLADSGILHDPDFEPPEIVAARSARDTRALLAGVNFGSSLSASLSSSGGSSSNMSSLPTMMTPLASTGTGAPGEERRRGFLLTGSVDRRVTLWDIGGDSERCAVLSGLEPGAERPKFLTERDPMTGAVQHIMSSSPPSSTATGRPSQRTNMISTHQQQAHKMHADAVTALALLDAPFRGCIVSGDRAGVLKVLRVDSE